MIEVPRWPRGLVPVLLLVAAKAIALGGGESEELPAWGPEELSNELVVFGHSLSIPPDWEFIPEDSDVTFSFRSPEDIVGSLEIVEFGFKVDVDELSSYLQEDVFQSDGRVRRRRVESEELGSGWNVFATTGDRRLSSFVFPGGGDSALLLHMSTPNDIDLSDASAVAVLETYRFHPTVSFRRRIPGRPEFVSFDDRWQWVGDYAGGFHAAHLDATGHPDFVVGIWPIGDSELQRLEDEDGFDIDPFDYDLVWSGRDVRVRVHGSRSHFSFTRLYGVFEWDGVQYCIFLGQPVVHSDKSPEAVIGSELLRDFQLFYLTMP
jgi:hypothetical protein